MSGLVKRALSGAVYVFVIVTALSVREAWLWGFVLFSVFYFVLADEMIRVMKLHRSVFFGVSALFWMASSAGIIYTAFNKSVGVPSLKSVVALIGIIWLIFAFLLVFRLFKGDYKTVFALVYLGIPYVVTLFVLTVEPLLILFLFVLIWLNDTFAYLSGTLWGKHKLAPSVSPKKTWEGVLGGALAVVLFVWFLWKYQWFSETFYFIQGVDFAGLVPLLLTVVFLAVTGDLFESWLKRKAGLKDSSNLIPGHGGLLDRLDSYLFAVTGFFVYLFFVFKIFR